jgi:hypothetical protein
MACGAVAHPRQQHPQWLWVCRADLSAIVGRRERWSPCLVTTATALQVASMTILHGECWQCVAMRGQLLVAQCAWCVWKCAPQDKVHLAGVCAGKCVCECVCAGVVLQEVARTIERAGKSINFLRDACGDSQWVQDWAPAAAGAAAALGYGQVRTAGTAEFVMPHRKIAQCVLEALLRAHVSRGWRVLVHTMTACCAQRLVSDAPVVSLKALRPTLSLLLLLPCCSCSVPPAACVGACGGVSQP